MSKSMSIFLMLPLPKGRKMGATGCASSRYTIQLLTMHGSYINYTFLCMPINRLADGGYITSH